MNRSRNRDFHMIRRILTAVIFAAVLAMSLAAQSSTPNYYVLEVSSANLNGVLSQYGLTLVQALNSEDSSFLVSAPSSIAPATLIAQVTANPAVHDLEVDATLNEVESDPLSKVTPNIAAIQAMLTNPSTMNYYGATVLTTYVTQPSSGIIAMPQAQQAVSSNHPVVVAVIDTGVDPTHPALAGSLIPGYDFTRNQAGIPSEWLDLTAQQTAAFQNSQTVPLTQKNQTLELNQSTVVILDQSTVVILDGGGGQLSHFGHGTMTAGLIHLVAPQALIMPLKAFLADGSSDTANIVRAIYYAADNGANVISMSFSSETVSIGIRTALQYAISKGIVCVSAAGNDGEQELVFPAAQEGVIGVGSSTATDGRSTFSNYAVDSVKMAAPGEALLTTYPGNNYAGVWGTSFSTALVSGGAALMMQANPQVGSGNVNDALESGVQLNSSLGLGDGRLNLMLSLNQVIGDN
jgi:subtilisin family serine protease